MAIDRKKKVDTSKLPSNPYLKEPAAGLKLIASLLKGNERTHERVVDNILDELTGICGRLDLSETSVDFPKLRQIVNLLKKPARARLLRNTAIVGFGGQFSSGKSSILNSLLAEQTRFRLPEDTAASTSIATYVMRSSQETVVACSRSGAEIPLDPDALAAISHQFRSTHQINPAQYVDFIGISLPQFPVSGVALLDTPGYNASDVATQQEYRDNMRSQEALNSVDHLVWLISAKEPLLSESDQKFIKALNLSGDITVIVNKCDFDPDIYQSAEPERSKPIENIRQNFQAAGIRVANLIPYCAREPEWNKGNAKVVAFLKQVAKGKKSAQERLDQIESMLNDLHARFRKQLGEAFVKDMEEIDGCVDISGNPTGLGALVRMRGMMGLERSNLRHDNDRFLTLTDRFRHWLKGTEAM